MIQRLLGFFIPKFLRYFFIESILNTCYRILNTNLMPELPEVQTIVNDLNKKIEGDRIVGFWSDWKKAVKKISAKKFGEEIQGKKILGARRIGKNIFIDLSGKKTVYIHLKMTGHLLVKSSKLKVESDRKDHFSERVNQYVHHVFYLKTCRPAGKAGRQKGKNISFDKTLEFSDLRKFGKIVLADTDKLESLKEIKSLGIDALDKKFTLKKFKEILEKRQNSLIGIILMDQNLIAGIGNIYRSEILFDAKILPTRKIGDLKSKEIEKLYKSIQKILKKALKMRGTSDNDYRDTAGAPGGFHKVLKVYRREGQKCHTYRLRGKKCGVTVKRIKLRQRSVFYCPKCQN